jgi:hypothetical protein
MSFGFGEIGKSIKIYVKKWKDISWEMERYKAGK